ncbi:response regulator [Rhodobacterales bacterium LSUCC0031]|nr:response regulator [Rhodobacterales bacterium LSUCC0031]
MAEGSMAPSHPPGVSQPDARDDTLQLFSHDIRSAMSDVIGGLRLLDRHRLPPEAQLQIDRVQAAADTLAGLVDGALLAAAGDRLFQYDDQELDLAAWLSALEGRWSGRARAAGGHFVITRDGDLPPVLAVPQLMLDRIIGNLIANALIHAPGGVVTLDMRDVDAGVHLTIRDHGPGFSPQMLAMLGEGSDIGAHGPHAGAGLGLRIAASLTGEIGGRLLLSNHPDGGGVARVILPAGVVAPSQAQPDNAHIPDLAGLRILVAEDNLTNQTILRQILGRMRADVTCAADGLAALDALSATRFDIALIDIEMPRLSGLQVMATVRARHDAVAKMPMVALTAYVLRDNREAIYAAGADGIIGKPISSAADFGRAILRYVGRPSGLPEPEDVLYPARSSAAFGKVLDHDRFDALLAVAGATGAPELLQRLHEDLSAVLAALDQGVAAADLAQIRGQTHILIALSGAVGADRLYRLAEVLNIAAKRRRMADLAALYAPCRADLLGLIATVAGQAGFVTPDDPARGGG